MKILPAWLREFVDLPVDDRKLAEDLTLAGISVESVEGEGARAVFDVDFTPNRVDAMNHYGVARDCAAVYDKDLKPLSALVARVSDPSTRVEDPRHTFNIEIEDPQGCARYTARIIRNVRIAPSPENIIQRLALLDCRAINNVADASNYTLQEIGHPTHCFDLDLLEGGKIVVRRARRGEKLKTLDGVDHELHPEDLVIADAVKPVALAGVMGGFDSMITERTRNVLIESAWFDPASIRRTSRRHGMHTDASHRFERGADIGITPTACARVAELILQTGGGQLEGGEIDAFPRPMPRPALTLRRSEIFRILGQDIPEQDMVRILRRLGFRVISGHTTTASTRARELAPPGSGGAHAAVAEEAAEFAVEVPGWRLDVTREIDLIEEIARIYGYDRFANTLPGFVGSVVEPPHAEADAKLRESLLGLGYNEAVSLTFISQADAAQFSTAAPVEVANPISEEARVMRTSLLPGMLNMLAYNLNRGNGDVRLFEAGSIYERLGERTEEHPRLCLGATRNGIERVWPEFADPTYLVTDVADPDKANWDLKAFLTFKGDVEALLAEFDYRSLYFDAHSADYYHPGRSARAVMDGTSVAQFGQLHPRLAAERKLRQEVLLADIDLGRLYQHPLRHARYQPIPRFPAVQRDFSFVFDDSVTFERIHSAVLGQRIPELRDFTPVEIFRGGAVPAGKYSILVRATLQSPEHTLRDDEVTLWSQQIVKALETLGGVLRSQ